MSYVLDITYATDFGRSTTVEVSTGLNLVNLLDVTNAIIAAESARDIAEAKASEASTSATNALASESAALVSENNAKLSETNAKDSEDAAKLSENSAKSSETVATTKASEASTSATNASASESAARQIFEQFGDQYLGPHATDPTTDNTGGPLADGNIYWNTTDNVLKFYTGTAWVAPEDIASTAASQAQSSATAAAQSATSANSSAQTATTQAGIATTKADEARASASNADSSAQTATTKADEASASATSADSSAQTATTQAGIATTKADEASASVTSANSSAQTATTQAGIATTARVEAEAARDSAREALSYAIPYSADIWDETNDTHTSEGITTGLTEVHKNMRRCLLLDDGSVNYYLDANDSNLKEDGTPSVLTGDDGQVMVEIQKCWVQAKYIQGGSSPIIKWSVSAEPKAGYVLHPAFTRGGTLQYSTELGMWHYVNPTEELDYVYVGAYGASVFDTSAGVYIDGLNLDSNTARVNTVEDKLSSVSGFYPMVGLRRAEFRTIAANRGANWELLDFWTHSLTQILFITEYHDLNTQLVLGDGNVSVATGYPASSSEQTDSPHSVAGKSNSIGNSSGSVTSTVRDTAWMSYRGIENWYGNCWNWVDGVNINDYIHYVSNTGGYVDNTSVGYTQLGVAAPNTNGYIRQVQANTLSFIPLSVSGGSSSIAFADNYWQNTGWLVLRVGGAANNGVAAGGFSWLANTSAASRDRAFGSRLVYKKKL